MKANPISTPGERDQPSLLKTCSLISGPAKSSQPAFGFSPVELECMGAVEGWQPVGTGGRFEYAHVELYRGGVASVPACATSQHFAWSDGNFGAVVWGTDHGASYGYPAHARKR